MMKTWRFCILATGALLALTTLVAKPSHGAPQITSCPQLFHAVALPEGARQCQQFDSGMPASMVYFVAKPSQDIIRFYSEAFPSLKVNEPVSQRTLLSNNDIRIVVSPDGDGSQVDILIAPVSGV